MHHTMNCKITTRGDQRQNNQEERVQQSAYNTTSEKDQQWSEDSYAVVYYQGDGDLEDVEWVDLGADEEVVQGEGEAAQAASSSHVVDYSLPLFVGWERGGGAIAEGCGADADCNDDYI